MQAKQQLRVTRPLRREQRELPSHEGDPRSVRQTRATLAKGLGRTTLKAAAFAFGQATPNPKALIVSEGVIKAF